MSTWAELTAQREAVSFADLRRVWAAFIEAQISDPNADPEDWNRYQVHVLRHALMLPNVQLVPNTPAPSGESATSPETTSPASPEG